LAGFGFLAVPSVNALGAMPVPVPGPDVGIVLEPALSLLTGGWCLGAAICVPDYVLGPGCGSNTTAGSARLDAAPDTFWSRRSCPPLRRALLG
jgi:hypothetical protein